MGSRVLIVDDSEIVREIIRMLLEKFSDVEICGEASNGAEAVQKAIALQPDLVVLDVVMPEMNGIEAASVIKNRVPETKTILFTMYGDYVQSLAGAAGADVLVAKADGMSPLVEAVHALIKSKPSVSPDEGIAPRRPRSQPA